MSLFRKNYLYNSLFQESLGRAEACCTEHRNYDMAADDCAIWLQQMEGKVEGLATAAQTKDEVDSQLTLVRVSYIIIYNKYNQFTLDKSPYICIHKIQYVVQKLHKYNLYIHFWTSKYNLKR